MSHSKNTKNQADKQIGDLKMTKRNHDIGSMTVLDFSTAIKNIGNHDLRKETITLLKNLDFGKEMREQIRENMKSKKKGLVKDFEG